MVNINEAYQQLTPEHQREVEDFAEFLLQREKLEQSPSIAQSRSESQEQEKISSRFLNLSWVGGLKDEKKNWKELQQHRSIQCHLRR